MNKSIELAKLTNGRIRGVIEFSAWYWETRYSWGHKAAITNEYGSTLATAKIRYYNRTWEVYRFQSVLHSVIAKYVESLTKCNPYRDLSPYWLKTRKSKEAENRRLLKVQNHEFAATLYKRLCDFVDGKTTDFGETSKIA